MTDHATTYREDIEEKALAAMGETYVEEFIGGYVECALWSEPAWLDIADDGTVTESPDDDTSFQSYGFDESDIERESMENMRADCLAFIVDNSADLMTVARMHRRSEWSAASQSGHDFWLTRNHHGAGFWDRGYGPVGDRLSTACAPYGDTHLYAIVADPSNVASVKIGVE